MATWTPLLKPRSSKGSEHFFAQATPLARQINMAPFTKPLLTLVTTSCLWACGDPSATQTTAQRGSANTPATQPVTSMKLPDALYGIESEAAIKRRKLMQAESRCSKTNNTIENAFARYNDWIQDKSAGPSGKEIVVHGIFEVPSDMVDRCVKQLRAALTLPPQMQDLDSSAQEYIQAMQIVAQNVAAIRPYYANQHYKKDALARGKKAHAGLIESFEQFDLAKENFSDQTEALDHKITQETLVEFNKLQGKNLVYWREAIALDARVLVSTLHQPDFDRAKAQQQLSHLASTLDQAANRTKSHPEEVHPQWGLMMDAARSFEQIAKDLLTASSAQSTGQKTDPETSTIGVAQNKLRSMYLVITMLDLTLQE